MPIAHPRQIIVINDYNASDMTDADVVGKLPRRRKPRKSRGRGLRTTAGWLVHSASPQSQYLILVMRRG